MCRASVLGEPSRFGAAIVRGGALSEGATAIGLDARLIQELPRWAEGWGGGRRRIAAGIAQLYNCAIIGSDAAIVRGDDLSGGPMVSGLHARPIQELPQWAEG